MSLKLTPDELGDAGESNFKLLCSQAKLVCNKSSRDLTGWDFITEFPMTEPRPAVALHQRPTAARHVQVKSTAGARRRSIPTARPGCLMAQSNASAQPRTP